MPLSEISSTPTSSADLEQYQFRIPAETRGMPSQQMGNMASTSATPAQMMGGVANGGLQLVPTQTLGVMSSGRCPAKPIYVAMGLKRGEHTVSAHNCGVPLGATAAQEPPFDPTTQYIGELDEPNGHFHPSVWATLQEVHCQPIAFLHNGHLFLVFFSFGTVCRHFAAYGAESITNPKGCGRRNCRWHHGKSREDLLAWIYHGPQGLQNFLLQRAMARPPIVWMPVARIPWNQAQLPDGVEISEAEVQHADQPNQNVEGTLVQPTPSESSAHADAGDHGEHQVMPADGPH